MTVRKVHCSIVEGLVYEDRCLFKLSKIIEGNKTCENCLLRELEEIKHSGDKKKRKLINPAPGKTAAAKKRRGLIPGQTMVDDIKQSYSVQDLTKLLGRSRRRIQELAKDGKIPARKVGRVWEFPTEETDQWLLERKKDSSGIPRPGLMEGRLENGIA